jgi:hypothetical protein
MLEAFEEAAACGIVGRLGLQELIHSAGGTGESDVRQRRLQSAGL